MAQALGSRLQTAWDHEAGLLEPQAVGNSEQAELPCTRRRVRRPPVVEQALSTSVGTDFPSPAGRNLSVLHLASACATQVGTWLVAQPTWLWFTLVVAAATVLRVIPYAAAYPLHRDEALYGTWARMIADGSDPLLLTAWVDKPPLVLYLLASSFRLFGSTDAVLRLPGMGAGVLILPVTFFLVRRAGGNRWASLLAMAFVAASPYAILFGPTAFTDTWLSLWLALAAWAALARRPFLAGLALGLAVASKQTGLLGAPLVAMLLLASDPVRNNSRFARPSSTPAGRAFARHPFWARFTFYTSSVLSFAAIFGILYWWDSLRWAKRPSFWDRSLETYGGLALANPATWPERAAHWAEQVGYLSGSPAVTIAVLFLVIIAVYTAWRRRNAIDLALAAFIACYLAVHFFVTFQPWDRYLLPLVPVLAVLAARGCAVVWQRRSQSSSRVFQRGLLLAALAVVLVAASWLGSTGRVPVGSDHSAYAGQDKVIATLRTLAPQSKVYHHSLGWQLDWYLYRAPQGPVWWVDAATLAEDAAYTAAGDLDRPQWLAIAWASDAPVAQEAESALRARGLTLEERQRVYRADGTLSFTLYEILPPRENP